LDIVMDMELQLEINLEIILLIEILSNNIQIIEILLSNLLNLLIKKYKIEILVQKNILFKKIKKNFKKNLFNIIIRINRINYKIISQNYIRIQII